MPTWITYAIIAIMFTAVSDMFRKLAAQELSPYFANVLFQFAAFSTGMTLFLTHRKIDNNPRGILFAVIGGMLVAMFTFFSFRTLAIGPGVSVVMPVLRVGGVSLVAVLGVVVLKDSVSLIKIVGLIFAVTGIIMLTMSE